MRARIPGRATLVLVALLALPVLNACEDAMVQEPEPLALEPVGPVLTAQIDPEGLIASLPFDGDTADVSGNGHDAVLSTTGTAFVDGCQDQALLLDGQYGFAMIPWSADLEPEHVTVEVFFRHADQLTDGEGFVPLVVKMPYGGNFWNTVDGWDLWYQDSGAGGRLGFGIGSQGGKLRVNASEFVEIPAEEPIHIVGTYDGRRLALYVNGRQVAITGHHEPIAYLFGPVWIGGAVEHSYYGYGDHSFAGTLDEVAIWGRALSAREVRERYQRHLATVRGHGGRDDGYVPHAD